MTSETFEIDISRSGIRDLLGRNFEFSKKNLGENI